MDGADARPRCDAPVLIGVGAAFDFHAGLVPQAPALDAALRPRVAVPAARRSRAGCGGATCATTRASSPGFARQLAQTGAVRRIRGATLARQRAGGARETDRHVLAARGRGGARARRRRRAPTSTTTTRRPPRAAPGDLWVFARGVRRRDPRAPLRRRAATGRDWTSIGGNATSGPAAAAYGARIQRLRPRHRRRRSTRTRSSTARWTRLGRRSAATRPRRPRRSPAAADELPRRRDQAAATTRSTSAPSSPATGWHGWGALGGNLTSRAGAELAVRRHRSNVFARGTDGARLPAGLERLRSGSDWSTPRRRHHRRAGGGHRAAAGRRRRLRRAAAGERHRTSSSLGRGDGWTRLVPARLARRSARRPAPAATAPTTSGCSSRSGGGDRAQGRGRRRRLGRRGSDFGPVAVPPPPPPARRSARRPTARSTSTPALRLHAARRQAARQRRRSASARARRARVVRRSSSSPRARAASVRVGPHRRRSSSRICRSTARAGTHGPRLRPRLLPPHRARRSCTSKTVSRRYAGRAASLLGRNALRRLRHRTRPDRPPARAQLRRRRALRARRRQRRRAPRRRSRERRMPFKEPGTDELLARVRPRRSRRTPPTPRRPTRSCSRSARRRCRTSRSTWATSAPCSTTCCRALREDQLLVLRSTVAPGHDRVRRRLPGEAARLPRRRGPLRRPRAGADRRRPLHGGDRHAAVHRRRRRRGVRRARRAAVRAARRADRADHAGAGRAGEDLDQHPALRDVRAARTC